MEVNINFVNRAEPCTEKPKGCYEKISDNLYVATWMGWKGSVSLTRDGCHHIHLLP